MFLISQDRKRMQQETLHIAELRNAIWYPEFEKLTNNRIHGIVEVVQYFVYLPTYLTLGSHVYKNYNQKKYQLIDSRIKITTLKIFLSYLDIETQVCIKQ